MEKTGVTAQQGKAVEAGSSATSAAGSAAPTGAEVAGSAWDKVKGTASGLLSGDDQPNPSHLPLVESS